MYQRSSRLPADEPALFAAAQAGDARARETLAARYLPLAKHLAARFSNRHESMDDLIQVACVGLIGAIGRFDATRGVAFTTFAMPTILGELRRHFRDHGWAVRPPRRLQERWLDIVAARSEIERGLGRTATVAELAAALDASEEEVVEALDAARAQVASSFDEPVGEDGATLGDLTGGSDRAMEDAEARLTLELASRRLTPRQRAVLWLHATRDLTQEQIASLVGVSQMQVSRDLRTARDAVQGSFD